MAARWLRSRYFNPRLPGGRRLITIIKTIPHDADFNPRLPGGRRQYQPVKRDQMEVFQSTPPGWEATSNSIKGRRNLLNFNPRLPGGRRLLYLLSSTSKILNFNPRLPGGRRLLKNTMLNNIQAFQSTPPGWEATSSADQALREDYISIHASRVGGDHAADKSSIATTYFNPRLPGGRRLLGFLKRLRILEISIHASRVGGDWAIDHLQASSGVFQSTPPGWEATSM